MQYQKKISSKFLVLELKISKKFKMSVSKKKMIFNILEITIQCFLLFIKYLDTINIIGI